MIKKILIVALKYSYGRRDFGPSINQGALIDSLNTLGYTTNTIWIDEHSKDLLNKIILKEANIFNPDLIFFKLFKNEINSETLLKLKKIYKTINWFGDDQWRFNSFTKYYANKFTFCITTDKFSIEKYKKLGIDKIFLSQHASILPEQKFKKHNYIYDVSFVGTKSPYRDWFLKELKKRGINCVCFGKGWSNGLVSYKEMEKIFLSSKINLNICNSLSFDLRVNVYQPRNLLENLK